MDGPSVRSNNSRGADWSGGALGRSRQQLQRTDLEILTTSSDESVTTFKAGSSGTVHCSSRTVPRDPRDVLARPPPTSSGHGPSPRENPYIPVAPASISLIHCGHGHGALAMERAGCRSRVLAPSRTPSSWDVDIAGQQGGRCCRAPNQEFGQVRFRSFHLCRFMTVFFGYGYGFGCVLGIDTGTCYIRLHRTNKFRLTLLIACTYSH